jgi:hypothetical protein
MRRGITSKEKRFSSVQPKPLENQATAWIPVEWWDACPPSLPSDAELQRLSVSGGLDMSQKIDLASFVAVFKEPLPAPVQLNVMAEDEAGRIEQKTVSLNYRVYLLPMFWIPEDTMLEHEQNDKVPYSLWAKQEWVTPTEGDIIDDDRIFRDIVKLAARFPKLKEGGSFLGRSKRPPYLQQRHYQQKPATVQIFSKAGGLSAVSPNLGELTEVEL